MHKEARQYEQKLTEPQAVESDRQKIQMLEISGPEDKMGVFYRRNKRNLNMSIKNKPIPRNKQHDT